MFFAYNNGIFIAKALDKDLLKRVCQKAGFFDCVISEEPPKPPTLTPEQQLAKIKKERLKAVDDYMDRTVQERGYDNIAKCVTYEGDIDETFNREGTLAKQWRSKVYRKCYDILAEVEAGLRDVPTAEELIAELPKLEW